MKNEQTYRMGTSTLTVRFGDITTSDAEVIVSSDDCLLSMGGGVSAAILRSGGEAIILDASRQIPAMLGDAVMTTGGALKARYVFHAITIGPGDSETTPAAIVESTMRRCMRMLGGLRLSSIAFPVIGAGKAGFRAREVAAVMARVFEEELVLRESPVNATLYLFERHVCTSSVNCVRFFEEFSARALRQEEGAVAMHEIMGQIRPPCLDVGAVMAISRLRRRLDDLEDERGRMDRQLRVLRQDGSQAAELRAKLDRNRRLRLRLYEAVQSL